MSADEKDSKTTPLPASSDTKTVATRPMECTLVGGRLVLAKQSQLSDRVSSLAVRAAALRLIFFPPEMPNGERPFFSYSLTADELSLVMHECYLNEFPANTLVLSPGRWRAIQIYEGPEAIDEVGIAALLSKPLADSGMEVLYVSTFNTDLILVKEEKAAQALELLKERLAVYKTQKMNKSKTIAAAATSATAAPPHLPSASSAPALLALSPASPLALAASQSQSLLSQQLIAQSTNSATATATVGATSPPLKSGASSPALSPLSPPATSSHPSSFVLPAPAAKPNTAAAATGSAAASSGIPRPASNPSLTKRASVSSPHGPTGAAGGGGVRMTLTPLSTKLAICGFQRSDLSKVAHALLGIILEANAEDATAAAAATAAATATASDDDSAAAMRTFFSYTDADHEISLIVPQRWIARLPTDGCVARNDKIWRAIRVSEGTAGFDAGVVSPLTNCLAKVGVSIYYLSTSDSDFTLCSDTQLSHALAAIRLNFSVAIDTDDAANDADGWPGPGPAAVQSK